MEKEEALNYYKKVIEQSWTYKKLTEKEKNIWNYTINSTMVKNTLRGNFKQRCQILNAIYGAFLNALDFTAINWREEI